MTCEEKFESAFKELLVNEGFLANDPDDAGGKTLFGVASKYHPETYALIHTLWFDGKKELAMDKLKRFYKIEFWNNNFCFLKDTSLAFKLFDLSVNIGVKKLIRIYQNRLNLIGKNLIRAKVIDYYEELITDGIFGQRTLITTDMLNSHCDVYRSFIERIEWYYKTRLTYWKFGKGWMSRLNKRYYLV